VDRSVATCADAAGRLNALWAAETARAGAVFGRRLFPGAATEALARAELMAALPAAHDFLIGASRSAAEIIRQQMLLNAVHEAGAQWASEAGNAAALASYTEARAEAQTVAAYRAIGRQAETWVPMLKIVFECLYVGAFPMAVLLMLTPAGAAIFKTYVTGLVWLQSWGPLYAILHRIAMGEAAERMGAAALMPGGDVGVSLVAQAGIRAVATDVAVMSGYLSMSVPFLAAALAFGVSRMTSLATSVLHVGQEAAGAAARESSTGNLSLGSTQVDTHRYAEGRQIRTSAQVDDHRHTGYAAGGAAFTVTGDGTVVADAASATSRIPAAGVRLSESLAASHEQRASEARNLSRQFSAEAGTARSAAVTDATRLAERYARDVSTGEAHALGVTESESAQVQALQTHYERMAETAGLTKDQMAVLAAEARIGGGWNKVVKIGVEGSARWRGQTVESEAWNRLREYAESHQVLDLASRVSEASRRYSTQTGDSRHAGLEESLAANLSDMRRFEERASLAQQELESWAEQASRVRSEAQAIDRELGQPFFAWLTERPGAGAFRQPREERLAELAVDGLRLRAHPRCLFRPALQFLLRERGALLEPPHVREIGSEALLQPRVPAVAGLGRVAARGFRDPRGEIEHLVAFRVLPQPVPCLGFHRLATPARRAFHADLHHLVPTAADARFRGEHRHLVLRQPRGLRHPLVVRLERLHLRALGLGHAERMRLAGGDVTRVALGEPRRVGDRRASRRAGLRGELPRQVPGLRRPLLVARRERFRQPHPGRRDAAGGRCRVGDDRAVAGHRERRAARRVAGVAVVVHLRRGADLAAFRVAVRVHLRGAQREVARRTLSCSRASGLLADMEHRGRKRGHP